MAAATAQPWWDAGGMAARPAASVVAPPPIGDTAALAAGPDDRRAGGGARTGAVAGPLPGPGGRRRGPGPPRRPPLHCRAARGRRRADVDGPRRRAGRPRRDQRRRQRRRRQAETCCRSSSCRRCNVVVPYCALRRPQTALDRHNVSQLQTQESFQPRVSNSLPFSLLPSSLSISIPSPNATKLSHCNFYRHYPI